MKEFKFNANLCSAHISPADNNYVTYAEARREIQNMRGLHVRECPYVEVIIRVPDPRQDWIDKWYAEAKEDEKNGDILIKFCKDVTIICVYAASCLQEIATAAPVHGDKYDRHTGIAVAYAKLCNVKIPDYI